MGNGRPPYSTGAIVSTTIDLPSPKLKAPRTGTAGIRSGPAPSALIVTPEPSANAPELATFRLYWFAGKVYVNPLTEL